MSFTGLWGEPAGFRRAGLAGMAAACLLLLFGCEPLNMPLPQGALDLPGVQTISGSGSFSYSVDTGTSARDVYFIFSNTSTSTNLAGSSVGVANGQLMVDDNSLPVPAPLCLPTLGGGENALMREVGTFNRQALSANIRSRDLASPSFAQVTSPAASDVAGSTASFYSIKMLSETSTAYPNLASTCRLVRTVTDSDGLPRSVSIWVENARWTSGGDGTITQAMVDALADRFLKTPNNTEDIYHWGTALLGEPWGATSFDSLIKWDSKRTITIFLANLNEPVLYTPGHSFAVGFFWAYNNFAPSMASNSNQRIMFYLDANTYAAKLSTETAWSLSNYWPEVVVSTLGHEFQHMIQFYQKSILARGDGEPASAWLDEMCSLLMEDLLSEKLGVPGPRGVAASDGTAGTPHNTDGRIPDFNKTTSLDWYIDSSADFGIDAYSQAYMLGAWLIRNFGGATMLRKIVHSPDTDQAAILSAISGQPGAPDSFSDLIGQWAASVLLSDRTIVAAGTRYNYGGWFPPTATTEHPEVQFKLGSINAFNYDYQAGGGYATGPSAYQPGASLPSGAFYRASNVYCKAASGLAGKKTWKLKVPEGVVTTVVLK